MRQRNLSSTDGQNKYWLIGYFASLLVFLVLVTGSPARADVLLLESIETQKDVSHSPQKGQSKQSVEARYGTPEERLSAVGQPPISRWIYEDFTVYFEYDHVIHSVPNRD